MGKSRKKLWGTVAMSLATVMLFTSIDWGMTGIGASYVQAAEEENNTETKDSGNAMAEQEVTTVEEEPDIECEITEQRTENSTTYLMTDGSYMTDYYYEPVRYEEDGTLIDYDSSLVEIEETDKSTTTGYSLESYIYENSASDCKNYIPENLTADTPLIMENGEYSITMAPSDDESDDNVFTQADELEKVDTISEDVTDIYDNTEEKIVDAVYSSEEQYDLLYTSINRGLKESVILNEAPETNVWKFELELNGVTPVKDECCNGISFFAEGTDDIVGGIGVPFMNDATGEAYSEDIEYDIELKDNSDSVYILTMTVDEDYLYSADRVYPVTIDPTITWSSAEPVDNVYVSDSSANMNYYSANSSILPIGRNSDGKYFRTYFKFKNLDSRMSDYSITSATLYLTEYTGHKGEKVSVHRVLADWNKDTITWNNRPTYKSTAIDNYTATGAGQNVVNLDLTSYVKAVSSGTYPNYGIMLRTVDEVVGYQDVIYNVRHSNPTFWPKLTIQYIDKPTDPSTVSASSYYIKKGTSLKVSWSGVVSDSLKDVDYSLRLASSPTNNLTSGVLGTTASGSVSIEASASWTETAYRLYVYSYDKNGHHSPEKKYITFYIDNTVPVISTASISPSTTSSVYSKNAPTLTWAASDTYFAKMQYRVGSSGSYKTLSSSASGSAAIPASALSQGNNSIYLRAVDKSGNVSAAKTFSFYYDSIAPVVNTMSLTPATGTDSYGTQAPVIKYTVSDISLKDVQYSVDGSSYISGGTSGSIQTKASFFSQTKTYSISIRAVDKAGNYSTVKSCKYYFDSDIPVWGITDILPYTDEDNSSHMIPSISWADVTDNTFKAIEYSVNGGTYKELSKAASGVQMLSEEDFTESGRYNISLRAVDKAGHTSSLDYVYYYRDYISEISDYKSNGLIALNKVNGDSLLKWENHGEIPSDISYNIYAGTQSDFVIDESSLIASGIKDYSTVVDTSEQDTVLYYKVCAVRTDEDIDRTVIGESSPYAVINVSADDTDKRMGIHGLSEMASIDTPYGTSNAELTMGNLSYSENDFTLAGDVLPLTMERTYNSQSTSKGILGNWIWAYSDEIAIENNDVLYYRDNTGTVYTFVVNEDNDYECDELEGIVLNKIDEEKTVIVNDAEGEHDYIFDCGYSMVKDGITLYFTAAGELIYILADTGEYTILKYSELTGLIELVSSSEGQYFSVDYDAVSLACGSPVISLVTLTDGSRFHYEYDNGQLIKISREAEQGDVISHSYTYNSDGNLSQISDGLYYKFSNGKLNDTAENTCSIYSYEYTNGMISGMWYPDGSGKGISYNDDTHTSSVTTYDCNKANLATETVTYETVHGLTTRFVNSKGMAVTYVYDNLMLTSYTTDIVYNTFLDGIVGNIKDVKTTVIPQTDDTDDTTSSVEGTEDEEETEPDINVYDIYGNLTYFKDGETGEETEYIYDGFERQIQVVTTASDSATTTENYTYDANGNIILYASGDVQKTYTYNNMNNLTEVTTTDGNDADTVTIEYKSQYIAPYAGTDYQTAPVYTSCTIERNSSGYITSESYSDSSQNIIREKSGGVYTDYTYDDMGRCVSTCVIGQTSDNGTAPYLTIYLYDENGNKTNEITGAVCSDGIYSTNSDSVIVSRTYNISGKVLTQTDGNGNVISYTYDDNNNLTGIESAQNSAAYSYEQGSDKVNGITHNGFTYGFSYNSAGNLTSVTVTDTSILTNSYVSPDSSNISQTEYGNGDIIGYTYNGSDKIESITINGVTAYTYEYDTKGQMISETDIINGDKYTYDYSNSGVLLKTTRKPISDDNSESEDRLVTEDIYDSLERIEKTYESFPSGLTLNSTYSYQADSLVDGLTITSNNGNDDVQSTDVDYIYDSFKRLSERKVNDGTTLTENYTYQYAGAASMYQVETAMYTYGGNTHTYGYCYDKNGNILTVSEDGVVAVQYTYDSLDELVRVDDLYAQSTLCYTYDNAGNIMSVKEYAYTNGDIQTEPVNSVTYGYDEEWKDLLVSYDGENITYDEIGNPLTYRNSMSMTWDRGRMLSKITKEDDSYIKYSYDSDGIRTSKTYSDGTQVSYDLTGSRILSETRTSDNVNTTIYYLYDDNGSIIGLIYDGITYYYQKNIQGDIMNIIDQNGDSVVSYKYNAYGMITDVSGSMAATLGGDNVFRYRGYYYDEESGLYYLNSRYYDPETGRFINADEVVDTESVLSCNIFTYCENNPIILIDKYGMIPRWVILGVIHSAINGSSVFSWPQYYNAKSILSAAGNGYLRSKKLEASRTLYNHAMWKHGKNLSSKEKKKVVKVLKDASCMKSLISEFYKDSGHMNYTRVYNDVEFENDEKNNDLYFSLQHVDITIIGKWRYGKWTMTVKVEDYYNFDNLRFYNERSFGSAANDLGWAMERIGMMTPFDIDLSYTV